MRGAALIVLAWNQWPLTRRCLDSLLASDLDETEVIVVDNGSSDETPLELAAYTDRVRVVTLPENRGFVRGMNAGIAAARADDDVVLLNNDLVFTQADWLGRVRDAAYADPKNGIVGCRLLGPEVEGRVYHVGGYIEPYDLHGEQTESGLVEREVAQYPHLRGVHAIAFAVAYLRRDCLDRIGRLDEAFHSYFEDTDYCLRAADAGIASVVAGAVTLRHDQHGSTGDDGRFRARLFAQSRTTFAARWCERLRADYRGDVTWHGATRFPHVQAELARLFVRRLDARGLRMAFAPVALELGDAQDRRLDLAASRRAVALPDVALVCAPGAAFTQARGRRSVGIAFGEWERVPETWAPGTNALDLLIVPDAFQRDAFRAAGVSTPIEILPLGIDRDYCHTAVPAPRHPQGACVFLTVVEELARDAPDVLVAAFRRAFGEDEPVELLIHIRPGRDTAAISSALAPVRAGDARVRILDGWGFPWHQRAQLLSAADAYVSARRGGGWDPLAAEALACGRVLVATVFGSQAELVRAYGLPVAVARLVEDPAHPGLRWAEPDADALAAQLRIVFEQRARLVADAHARAAAFACEHDIEASANRLVELLARGGTLAAPRVRPAPHRPAQLMRPAGGQIVVLGMHRSGTSSVAGLLARMGASAGPEDDLLVGPDNPKGHYESARLHGACLRRLAAAGGDWKNPPTGAPPAAIDTFRREVAALLDTFDAQRPWLIKEPRLCLLARELLPLLTRPVFVHVVRDPHEVADSLAARDDMARAPALALWEHYTDAAFEASRGWPRLVVDYADLLADPVRIAARLRTDLGALGVGGLLEPDPARVREWIEPPSGRARAPVAARIDLSAAQRALWAAIVDRSILHADGSPVAGLQDGGVSETRARGGGD
ncbi:glycosyltransferase [Dokdonella soli]|uniref:Glycosyltransferase 2-like domain-containing protein n=1 Tax=Dokdonella soli TaxID=529810 RepID=A0ABN1IGW0_9GAMM